jgi:hypothetical protein
MKQLSTGLTGTSAVSEIFLHSAKLNLPKNCQFWPLRRAVFM